MEFSDYLAKELGTRQWCVAARLTSRLRAKGYTVALTPKRYAALEEAWAAGNPTEVLQRVPMSLRRMLTVAGLLNIPKGEA